MQLWQVEHFFSSQKGVQLVKVAFFQSDFLQNSYFSSFTTEAASLHFCLSWVWFQGWISLNLKGSRIVIVNSKSARWDITGVYALVVVVAKCPLPSQLSQLQLLAASQQKPLCYSAFFTAWTAPSSIHWKGGYTVFQRIFLEFAPLCNEGQIEILSMLCMGMGIFSCSSMPAGWVGWSLHKGANSRTALWNTVPQTFRRPLNIWGNGGAIANLKMYSRCNGNVQQPAILLFSPSVVASFFILQSVLLYWLPLVKCFA